MRINRKLQSQRGASITFALLLFLVCAVVGSVVLAAGSAAAGRMAGLPRSDQRYYSVSSAARLFEDKFAEQKITIERTHSYNHSETTTVTKKEDGSYQYGDKITTDTPDALEPYKIIIRDSAGQEYTAPQDLFQKLTCALVLGDTELSDTTEAGWEAVYPVSINEKKTVSLTVGDKEDLAVDIEIQPATFTPGGGAQIIMDFKNHADSAADTKTPQFKLRMTWIADTDKPPITTEGTEVKEIPSVAETNKQTSYSGNTMTVTSEVTETKTTSVTWHVVSLEVIGGGTGS